jgi:predicted nucleotidyltransferase
MRSGTVAPRTLRAVALFGSTARGDADIHSDRDICAIVDDVDERQIALLKRHVGKRYGAHSESVSVYRISTLSHMIQNGALLLWHIKLEGKVLYDVDRRFERALGNLPEYGRYSEDLLRFQDAFDDTLCAFTRSRRLDLFDLHVLFVVVRNVCMLLTVRAGKPCFGRSTVYVGAVQLCGRLPVSPRLFEDLTRNHLVYLRGSQLPCWIPTHRQAASMLSRVSQILKFAWKRFQ